MGDSGHSSPSTSLLTQILTVLLMLLVHKARMYFLTSSSCAGLKVFISAQFAFHHLDSGTMQSTVLVTTQPPRLLLQFDAYRTTPTLFPGVENAPMFVKEAAALIPVLTEAFFS